MFNLTGMALTPSAAWAVGELVKGTLLLLLVFGVAAALRRSSAGLRHLVWSTGIVAVLALPIASVVVPWRLAVLPAVPAVAVTAEPSVSGPDGQVPGAVAEPASPRGNRASSGLEAERARPVEDASTALGRTLASGERTWRPTPARLVLVLVGLWLVGLLLIASRLALGAVLVRRIVTQARPLDTADWRRPLFEVADRLELRVAPRLVVSGRMPMPFVAGVMRPVIVLPASAEGWSDRRRRAVLFHELAHVRRLDLLVNMLGRLACALYWFHPLVWLAVRRQRAESERACDDMVLSIGTRASEYADHLLQIVCRAGRASTPAVALPMAQRKEFEGRMLAILEPGARRRGPSRRDAVASAALCLLLVVPLAAMRSTSRSSALQSGPDTQQAAPAPVSHSLASGAAPAPRLPQHPEVAHRPQSDPAGPSGSTAAVRTLASASGTEGAQDTVSARIIAALARALEDPAAEVRQNAAYALGEREARSAATALGRRLRQDDDVKVREMCAWALGQIETKDATEALSWTARSDPAETVRSMAVWALGQVEDPASVPALSAALADGSAEIRGRAAWALGNVEPRSAPPALLKALTDPASEVRLRAAWALGQIEDAAAVPALGRAADDSVAEVRSAAMWALGQMDTEEARLPLLRALESNDPKVRAAAVRALAGGSSEPWPWPWPMPIHR